MFIFSFAFRINIQITISLNRCANFVDMIRWSRNLKDCTFSHHTSTSAASLTHWTCDWYTYNFCCQHMVCDKPHSPVLHPCESDSKLSWNFSKLMHDSRCFKPWVDLQSSGSLGFFPPLHPSLDSVFIASSKYYIIQNISENLNWNIYLCRLEK